MTRRSLQAVTDGAWSLALEPGPDRESGLEQKWGAGGILASEVGWVRSALQCSGNRVYGPEDEPR